MSAAGVRPWSEARVGDGALDPAGVWHRVTRSEGGWIELDGAHAMPVPAGTVMSWDAMAAAVEVVAEVLGGQAVGHGA